MAGGKRLPTNGSLRRLRLVTGVVLVFLITFMLVAEAFAGALAIRSDYSAQPLVVGTLLGGLLLVIGIEIGSRWPMIGGGQNPPMVGYQQEFDEPPRRRRPAEPEQPEEDPVEEWTDGVG